MHSLDEPLDLKLSITKLRVAREKRERTLGVVRHRTLHRELGLVDDSPTPGSPGSPPSGFLLNPKFPEKVDGRFCSPSGRPQLITAIWTGLPQWQQLTVP